MASSVRQRTVHLRRAFAASMVNSKCDGMPRACRAHTVSSERPRLVTWLFGGVWRMGGSGVCCCRGGAHAAGCDIILNCWGKMADMQGICERLPAMSDATTTRLDRALASTRIAAAIAPEHAEMLAKRDALLALDENGAYAAGVGVKLPQ